MSNPQDDKSSDDQPITTASIIHDPSTLAGSVEVLTGSLDPDEIEQAHARLQGVGVRHDQMSFYVRAKDDDTESSEVVDEGSAFDSLKAAVGNAIVDHTGPEQVEKAFSEGLAVIAISDVNGDDLDQYKKVLVDNGINLLAYFGSWATTTLDGPV